MKILLINTFDTFGGAAIAANRLHKGLLDIGEESVYLVDEKYSDSPAIRTARHGFARVWNKVLPYLDRFPTRLYPDRERTFFSTAWAPNTTVSQINALNADIVHLHWTANGFIRLEDIARITKPVVWTLHDMWAFTGGCHYTGTCSRYLESCGQCPQLGSHKKDDLSSYIFKRKQKTWGDTPITFITPSRWLGQCAKDSPLLRNHRVEVIPNGINTSQYPVIEKNKARRELNLPEDKHLVLFGAMNATSDKRKGWALLTEALKKLENTAVGKPVELVIFGSPAKGSYPDLPFAVSDLATLSNPHQVACVYAAADVFIAPSLQENLSNMVMESLSCGTPVVAFNIGGMPDMIEHEKNGYLARAYETGDLAAGIRWVLEDPQRQRRRENARAKVEREFSAKHIAQKHLQLYHQVLGS